MNEKENIPAKPNPKQTNSNNDVIELNLNLPREDEDNGVTLKEIATIFKSDKPRIIVFTLLFLLVGILSAFIYYFVTLEYVGTVTGIISFNYKGAEDGLDPHGRQLDVQKIKSPMVLDKVFEELNLYEKGITVEDIKQNIIIEGIVPRDAMERILVIKEIATKDPSKLEELIPLSYIPTQYAVTFNVPKKMSNLKGSKGVELMNAVFNEYKNYFFEEYTDKAVLSTAIASLPYSDYDYDDAARVLNEQLNNVITYLSAKRNEAPDFRANSTQMSFGDLITNLNLLKSIDLSNIRSLIEVRLLTKDKAQLISSYKYTITQRMLERDIQTERARITKEAAENYQKDSAVLFGATGSTDSSMQFSQSSDTYDTLIRQAADASEQAIRLQSDIDYYEKRLADLDDPTIVSNNPADLNLVETAIDAISERLATWIDIVNKTVDEYMEVLALKDAAKLVLLPYYSGGFVSALKMMAIIVAGVTFIGFIVGVISVYAKSIMR